MTDTVAAAPSLGEALDSFEDIIRKGAGPSAGNTLAARRRIAALADAPLDALDDIFRAFDKSHNVPMYLAAVIREARKATGREAK